jgi:hypothetical protein
MTFRSGFEISSGATWWLWNLAVIAMLVTFAVFFMSFPELIKCHPYARLELAIIFR